MNVLKDPFNGGSRTVAIIQTDRFEVADALGHVANSIAGCGDLDIVECDGVKVVGSGSGSGSASGLDGCRCGSGRGGCGSVSEGCDRGGGTRDL